MGKDKNTKIKNALISVSNKDQLELLTQSLNELGINIISTGGTASFIDNLGIKVKKVSDITGFPEIMDGRVKTLHPKIYGGLLNRKEIDDATQEEHSIQNIDLIIVNLYPFENTIAREDCNDDMAIENIDIGGPAMIRASAKNFYTKTIVTDPNDYDLIIKELKMNSGSTSFEVRKNLSLKAFRYTADYDESIYNYFNTKNNNSSQKKTIDMHLSQIKELRYGENPHQKAGLYTQGETSESSLTGAHVYQGKPLSYNNLLDANTALRCVQSFNEPSCVIVKHVNPCGVATDDNLMNAYDKAFKTDPESAFGGVISVNREVDYKLAKKIIDNQFLELIIAPSFDNQALEIFSIKKNIRVISIKSFAKNAIDFQIQSIDGGFLIQEDDSKDIDINNLKVVTKKKPSNSEIQDMIFAWTVGKYVKSNAIVFAKNNQTIGIGAGQMSRVNSAKIASLKAIDANLGTKGCVMASDGFFPFSDSIAMASDYGISSIIQPGGSIRDNEVIAEADANNISMVFTGIRHFRH